MPNARYIFCSQPLSFESKKSYTLKVEGANPHLEMRFLNLGPFRDTTTVHISVEDVDEPPVFEPSFYFVEVPEDVEIGTTIQIISAKDPDVTNNSIRSVPSLCVPPGVLPGTSCWWGSDEAETPLVGGGLLFLASSSCQGL